MEPLGGRDRWTFGCLFVRTFGRLFVHSDGRTDGNSLLCSTGHRPLWVRCQKGRLMKYTCGCADSSWREDPWRIRPSCARFGRAAVLLLLPLSWPQTDTSGERKEKCNYIRGGKGEIQLHQGRESGKCCSIRGEARRIPLHPKREDKSSCIREG